MSDDKIINLFGKSDEETVLYSYPVDITRLSDGTLRPFVHREDEPTAASMEECAKDLVDAANAVLTSALNDSPVLTAIVLRSGSFITHLENEVQGHEQFDWLRNRVQCVAQSLWNKEMNNGLDERVNRAIENVANDKGSDDGDSA